MQLITPQTKIESIAVHLAGNPATDAPLQLSEQELRPGHELSLRLKDFFLNKFQPEAERFRFYHASSLQYNEVFNFAGEILTGHRDLLSVSKDIARHLHQNSDHPRIKPGELYVVHFNEVLLDNQHYQALGIFKTEQKNGFFEVHPYSKSVELEYREGIDIRKIDKACLVIDKNFEEGFEVLLIDQAAKGEEALYWKENFLRVEPVNNAYHATKNFLQATRHFIADALPEKVAVQKADQIDLLNRTALYMKANDTFEPETFEKEVLQDEDVIKAFRSYAPQNDYADAFSGTFDISPSAVKNQSKVFKSVLKLDKNFHIYIHGDRSLIEKGTDENGRKYYKIFFEEEN